MPRTIRQHFVPQCYLRHFVIPDEGERVWVRIQQNGKIVKQPIQSIASRNFFYDFHDNDQEQVVEKTLAAEVEGPFSALLRDLITDLDTSGILYQDKKFLLAGHMALQYLRTDAFREALRENLDAFGGILEGQLQAIHPELSGIKLRANIGGALHLHLGMNDENVRLIANILAQHRWRVVKAPPGRSFVTSDHPVNLTGNPPAPWMGVGFASYEARVLYPLSPRYLVLTQDYRSFDDAGHNGADTVFEVTSGMMDVYNGMVSAMAVEQVVAGDQGELVSAVNWLTIQKATGAIPDVPF